MGNNSGGTQRGFIMQWGLKQVRKAALYEAHFTEKDGEYVGTSFSVIRASTPLGRIEKT